MEDNDIKKHVTKCSDIDPDSLEASNSSKLSSCSCCENSSLTSSSCSQCSCINEICEENSGSNELQITKEQLSNFSSLEPIIEFDTAFTQYIESEHNLETQDLMLKNCLDAFPLFADTAMSSEQSELTLGSSNSTDSDISDQSSAQLINSLEFEDIDAGLSGLTSLALVNEEDKMEELTPTMNMDFYYINDICNECPKSSTGNVVTPSHITS